MKKKKRKLFRQNS